MKPFKIGDTAYCPHSGEWGKILAINPGDLVAIALKESGECVRLLEQLQAKQIPLPLPTSNRWLDNGTWGNEAGSCNDIEALTEEIKALESVKAEYVSIFQKKRAKRFEKAFPSGTAKLHANKDKQIAWCRAQLDSLKISPKKKSPSGSLYKFLQNKRNKAGKVLTYPKVEGDRQVDNPHHWFWAYCWEEKTEDGQWKTRKRSVRHDRLALVRSAIREGEAIAEILKLL